MPGVQLSINELTFILLPIINLLCYSQYNIIIKKPRIKRIILLLFVILFFNEVVVKNLFYGQSVIEAFKSIRIGFPLFSGLILIVQGLRVDIRMVWKTLLIALCFSEILSYVSLVIDLPIYQDIEGGANLLEEKKGRLGTANSTFGIIGLYLLIQDKDKWFNQGKLVKITSVLSLIGLLLGFNRTYLALIFCEVLYLTRKQFSIKKAMKILFFVGTLLGIGIYIYNTNVLIKNQIDRRILSIVLGEESLAESTIESNRDLIYDNIADRIEENHWIIGLPYRIPVFGNYNIFNEYKTYSKTDISLINILLRYGILVLILFLVILRRMYREKYFIPIVFWVYFLASFNTDSLLNQNSVFFLFLFSFIINYNSKKIL